MTSFEVLFDAFAEKIKQDVDFFMYDLPEEEIQVILNKRFNSLLDRAITDFTLQCNTDVNFENRDKEMQQFNFDVTPSEIDIISDLMVVNYLAEDVGKLKALTNYYGDKDLKIFSPANERKSFMDMFNDLKNYVHLKIKQYTAKDRLTGKPKTLNFDLL